MKKINQQYELLLETAQRAYESTIDTLNYHINKLQKIIAEQDARIEELTGGDRLAEQIAQITIDDSNVATVESCPGCDKVIDELRGENARLKKELQGAKISAGRLKANKTKKKQSNRGRYTRKSVVCQCKDCGTYFEAKSKNAKRCSKCRERVNNERKNAWAQHKKNI